MYNQGFHLLPFYTALLASGASNASLLPVNDPVVPIQNGRYFLPQDYWAYLAYVGAPDVTQVRVNMPSLILPAYPQLDPISLTALPANMPPLIRFGDGGMPLQDSEALVLEASRAVVAAADAFAALWISPKPMTKAPGNVRTLLATSTVTCVTGQWVAGNLTLSTNLQAGTYQIVGLSTYGTNLLFARIIFSNQVLRPGVLSQQAIGEWNDQTFRSGNCGVWGTFTNTTVPMMEFMSTGANTAQTVLIDYIKVG